MYLHDLPEFADLLAIVGREHRIELAYMTTSSLYYREMPPFSEILDAIQSVANRL